MIVRRFFRVDGASLLAAWTGSERAWVAQCRTAHERLAAAGVIKYRHSKAGGLVGIRFADVDGRPGLVAVPHTDLLRPDRRPQNRWREAALPWLNLFDACRITGNPQVEFLGLIGLGDLAVLSGRAMHIPRVGHVGTWVVVDVPQYSGSLGLPAVRTHDYQPVEGMVEVQGWEVAKEDAQSPRYSGGGFRLTFS